MNVELVRVHFFKNKDILNLALRKGIIDLPYSFPMANDASSLGFMKNLKSISLHSIPNFGVPKAIFFNTQKPPVNNPEMRRALAEAVDYQAMLNLISGEYGYQPNKSFVPAGTPGYVNTEPCVHDPESSKKRLAELGYKDSDGDGIVEKNGSPLVLDCVVHSESVENRRVAELIITCGFRQCRSIRICPLTRNKLWEMPWKKSFCITERPRQKNKPDC